jgi:hypothetical protein
MSNVRAALKTSWSKLPAATRANHAPAAAESRKPFDHPVSVCVHIVR